MECGLGFSLLLFANVVWVSVFEERSPDSVVLYGIQLATTVYRTAQESISTLTNKTEHFEKQFRV